MRYRRMPIEIESPEQLGYDRIRRNLAESSVAGCCLADLGVDLGGLVLQYHDHSATRGCGQDRRPAPALDPDDVLVTPGAAAALFIVSTTTLLEAGTHVVVARPNYATNIETPRAIGGDVVVPRPARTRTAGRWTWTGSRPCSSPQTRARQPHDARTTRPAPARRATLRARRSRSRAARHVHGCSSTRRTAR